MGYAIGFDLGGSSVKAVLVREEGEILARANESFNPQVPFDWGNKIKAMLKLFSEERQAAGNEPNQQFQIGVSAPGLAARDARSIACMPGRLEGLEGLNWTEYLKSPNSVPVPCASI